MLTVSSYVGVRAGNAVTTCRPIPRGFGISAEDPPSEKGPRVHLTH